MTPSAGAVDGYPSAYPREELPKLECYPDGQMLPTSHAIDFQPGVLSGCVSGELGLRAYLESNGHETSSKDGAGSVLERELPDAEIVISQPPLPDHPWRSMPHNGMTPPTFRH